MKFLFSSLFLILINSSYSQQIMKIEEADTKFRRDSLEEVYFNRIFSDEISSCFDVSQEMFIVEWSKYLRNLSKFIHDEKFYWGKKTMAQIEIYFNADEKVELLFITVRDKDFDEIKYQKLTELIKKFVSVNKFNIQAKIPFSNSGSITFMD